MAASFTFDEAKDDGFSFEEAVGTPTEPTFGETLRTAPQVVDFSQFIDRTPVLGEDAGEPTALEVVKGAPMDALGYVGNIARGAVADIAANRAGSEFAGNVPAAFQGEPLPVDAALAQAASEAPGWTTAAKISQGLAGSAPLIALFPQGALGKLVAAGFTADMIAHAGPAATSLGEELGKNPQDRDYDKLTTAISDLSQSAGFAPFAGTHAAGRLLTEKITPRTAAVMELARQLKNEPLTKAPVGRVGEVTPPTEEFIPRGEPFAQTELTAELINRAVENAQAPYGKARLPFEQALAELRGQELIPVAEARRRLIETGGGPAIGGKVSFQRPAEDLAQGRTVQPEIERAPKPPEEPPSPSGTPVPVEPKPPTTPQEAKPVVAKTPEPNEFNQTKNTFGDPTGTTYHATPTDWASWQEVTSQPITMETWKIREDIKNKYGGMPPEPPRTSPTPEATPKPTDVTPQSALPKAEGVGTSPKPAEFNWDAYAEELRGDLEAFNPARHTGKVDYDLMDVADRFVEFARNRPEGDLLKLISEFSQRDEATPSQIKKLRVGVKNLLPKPKERGMEVEQEIVSDVAPSTTEATAPTGTKPLEKPSTEKPTVSGEQSQAPSRVTTSFEAAIKRIEDAQQKLRKGPQSGQTLMGVPSAILDTALEAARLTLKAGKPIAEAIEAAIRHIRYNTKGKWDESKVRSMLKRELGGRGVQPADNKSRQGAGGARTGDAGATANPPPEGGKAVSAIESPEGQKPRSFSARATVSEKIPEPVQEAIAKDPRSSYTPQRISDVKEQVRRMSDAELGALTPESDVFTEGKAELADRLFSEGKMTEGLNVIQKTSEELTKAGQIINQAKVLNAMKPESRAIALDEMLKKAGKDPMTEAQKRTTLEKGKKSEDAQKRVDDATKEWERNPTPENAAKAEKLLDEANNAALDFQQWAHRFEPKTTPGILKAILQGNLLTPMSQTANLVGNMSFLPFRIGTRSLAAGMNIVQNALLGQKRTASVGPVSGTIQAAKGLARGASEIPSILKRGTGEAVVGERKTQLQPIRAWINQFSKNPDLPLTNGKLTLQDRVNLLMEGTIGIPAETMLRLLGAGDRPFREAAKYRATAEQLRLANVPKEQWSFAQKFPELFFNKEQLTEIKNQSDYAVFQRQSKTLNVIQRWIAEKGPWFDFAVATVAPYKVTPWNIIGEILSYNPVIAFSKALRDASKKDSRSMNLNASKFIIGSLMTTAATVLYKNGLLSPSLDAKDETMKERILSGQVMPPNHINVSGLLRLQSGGNPAFQPGDKTVDIMRGGGLFGAFAYMVANVGRDLEKSPDAGTDELIKSIITQSTLEQARFGMNQSFLSGVEGLLSAVKDGNADNYIQKWGNTVTSIPIPNTSSAVSRATREYKPDLTETTFNAKVKNLFANKLGWAGLDDYLPLKRGLWGEPLRETPQGRDALIYQLFDVSKGQQITSDPVPLELYRLWRKTADRSVIPTPPLRTITVKDKTYPLDAKQYEQLAIAIGKSRKERVDSLFENAFFMELTDEQKIDVLDKAYKKGAETGKKLFLYEYGDKIEPKPAKTGFK